MAKPKFFTIASKTDPQIRYKLIQNTDGTWICDCPNFYFHPSKDGVYKCKHIEEAILKLAKLKEKQDNQQEERANVVDKEKEN